MEIEVREIVTFSQVNICINIKNCDKLLFIFIYCLKNAPVFAQKRKKAKMKQ